MSGEPGGVKPTLAAPHGAEPAAGAGPVPETTPGAIPETTDDALLGGRVRFRQLRHGFRSGLEPVLLAASLPLRPGERVLEAGCGAGAGLLCAGARVPDLRLVGVEQDEAGAALARDNLRRNGHARWEVLAAPLDRAAATLPGGSVHHAFANPPWHRVTATASPCSRRDLARRAPDGMLAEWCAALARLLRHRGSLTLALPAALHAAAAAAMTGAGLGGIVLFPLWPGPGRPAKLVLVRGRRGSRSPDRVLPGLMLHREDGRLTGAAERLLRDGAALELDRNGVAGVG